jgi:hypothetical protein
MSANPAGYSGTPLARKLGISPGSTVLAKGAPGDYRSLLAPLPDGISFAARPSARVDVVHLFTTSRAELGRELRALRTSIREDAAIWVSWPKRSAKVPTDITEDTIREVALPLGLVDVKVCAVDATWSGLKLVIRRTERSSRG